MACCLMASDYLNQCRLTISEVLWHAPEDKFIQIAQESNSWCEFENYTYKIIPTSPRGQWVNASKILKTTPHSLPGDAIWQEKTRVNIDPGNGLMPDGSKPLSEPMLTSHQWGSVSLKSDLRSTSVSAMLYPMSCHSQACSPGGHHWNYYPGALSLSKITATQLMIGYP